MRKTERGNAGGLSWDDVELEATRRELYAAEEAHDRLEAGTVRDGADNTERAATQRVRRAWDNYRAAMRRHRFT